jgi:HSP20 family protein
MAIIRLKEPAFPFNLYGKGPVYQAFNAFQIEINRMFRDVSGSRCEAKTDGDYPPLNIYQDENTIYLDAELPGVETGDIKIKVEGNALHIEGDRKIETEQGGYYHRKERECGKFSRKITFRRAIAMDKAEAEYRDGILKITLLKEGECHKRINVSSQ